MNTQNRRIICHDDGGLVKNNLSEMGIDWVFQQRVAHLIKPGSQVDTYFYCGQDNFTSTFFKSNVPGVEVAT